MYGLNRNSSTSDRVTRGATNRSRRFEIDSDDVRYGRSEEGEEEDDLPSRNDLVKKRLQTRSNNMNYTYDRNANNR